MSEPRPSVVILAGPNGAGKSTVAPRLLRDAFGVDEFVNADVIARGLSAFDPDRVAMAAGRIMLGRLHEPGYTLFAAQHASFAQVSMDGSCKKYPSRKAYRIGQPFLRKTRQN